MSRKLGIILALCACLVMTGCAGTPGPVQGNVRAGMRGQQEDSAQEETGGSTAEAEPGKSGKGRIAEGYWGLESAAGSILEIGKPFHKGWVETAKGRYFFPGDGTYATGWHYIGSKAYYFYEKGDVEKAVSSEEAEDSEKAGNPDEAEDSEKAVDAGDSRKAEISAGVQAVDYTTSGDIYIPETGYLEGDEALAIGYALDVLDRYGRSLEAAFQYSAALRFQRASEEVYGSRIHKCAIQGFQYGKGNCLAWAGTFCVMARVLGYDCRLIWGTITFNGKELPHGWTEIWEEDGIHVYDPRRDEKKNMTGFNIRYGDPSPYTYNEDSRVYFEW